MGGLVLKIDERTQRNELELLFVNPDVHSKGIGYAAWQEVEKLYPETKVWVTCTPYFEILFSSLKSVYRSSELPCVRPFFCAITDHGSKIPAAVHPAENRVPA